MVKFWVTLLLLQITQGFYFHFDGKLILTDKINKTISHIYIYINLDLVKLSTGIIQYKLVVEGAHKLWIVCELIQADYSRIQILLCGP